MPCSLDNGQLLTSIDEDLKYVFEQKLEKSSVKTFYHDVREICLSKDQQDQQKCPYFV